MAMARRQPHARRDPAPGSVDIASAPFLWVIPLALYLLTFVLAFQEKPILPLRYTLLIQAGFVCACIATLPFTSAPWVVMFAVNLLAFFFTALMCHQTLAARRPPPDRLTEFYLWLAVGGVVGGAFNALLAPLIFNTVREYPLVLLAATLARPWPKKRPMTYDWVWLAVALKRFALGCRPIVAWMRIDPTARGRMCCGPALSRSPSATTFWDLAPRRPSWRGATPSCSL